MRRRPFAVVSIVSLLLCVATAVLWVRSYYVWDGFDWDRRPGAVDRCSIGAAAGKVFFSRTWLNSPNSAFVRFDRPPGFYEHRVPVHSGTLVRPDGSALGFSIARTRFAGIQDLYVCGPLWAPALFFLILASLRLLVRRPRAGHCNVCGYNLQGNTSGVCPECGTPVQQSATATAR